MSFRRQPIDPADPNLPKRVAVDRYRKQIKEQDANRAEANYGKAAGAGALAGLALRLKATSGKRALAGAGVGLLAEGAVRAIGRSSKDFYGERDRLAKKSEKIPVYGGLAAAGVLGYRRLKKFEPRITRITRMAGGAPALQFSMSPKLKAKLGLALRSAAVGGGALGGAGALSAALVPEEGEARKRSALRAAIRDGIFGTALYGASEPLLKKVLRTPRLFSADGNIEILGRDGKVETVIAPNGEVFGKALGKTSNVQRLTFNVELERRLRGAIEFIAYNPEEDTRQQRKKLAIYAGGALVGAAGLALLTKKRGSITSTITSTSKRVMPAGRGTIARQIAADKLRKARGYVNLRPMMPGQQKRFVKLPVETQQQVSRTAGLAHNPNLSPNEQRTARGLVGKLRKEHNFEEGQPRITRISRMVLAASRAGTEASPLSVSSVKSAVNFSAFIKDVAFKALPAETQANIRAFMPAVKGKTLFAHYGMVPKELAQKADPHNLSAARKAVRKRPEKACAGEIYKRRDSKHILVNNDRIVDGHHFLAKAERGKVNGSLHVIDLTPSRFQLERRRTSNVQRLTSNVELAAELPPWVQDRQRHTKRREHIREAADVAGVAGGLAGVSQLVYKLIRARKATQLERGETSNVQRLTSNVERRLILFRQQLRNADDDRFSNPYSVATGQQAAYYKHGNARVDVSDLPVAHAQVLRKVYSDAGKVRRIGSRVGALVRDTGDVIAGNPRRMDYSGRPQKREWEKSWFKKAATDVAIGAAGVGLLAHLKANPAHLRAVTNAISKGRKKINTVIPDFYAGRVMGPMHYLGRTYSGAEFTGGTIDYQTREFTAMPIKFGGKIDYRTQDYVYALGRALRQHIRKGIKANVQRPTSNVQRLTKTTEFDDQANWAGWDVRDPRGRSARVFAPGAQRRMRREKQWHEKVDTQRKLLAALAVVGTVGAGAAGLAIGRRNPIKSLPGIMLRPGEVRRIIPK